MSNQLKIYDDSKNYTCQVIKLPTKVPVKGLDNLVEVNYQGNSCLISKDSDPDIPYFFFPAESQISHEFLSLNNLYRHETLNSDPTKKGFFEDNRRVKAIKFRGIISSGFIIPATSFMISTHPEWKIGEEFNEVGGIEICRKYVRRRNQGRLGEKNPRQSVLDQIVDSKMVPEHPDTGHLMKNLHKLDVDSEIVITYKLHGTSARTYNALVKRKLSWKDKIAKFFGVKVQEEQYDYAVCSRRQVKSVGFEELPNKNHFFQSGDLWSEWAKKNLEGKLNQGEAIYYELVGKTYSGESIQSGYNYGFEEPKCFVYRISNINAQGIETDLSWEQVEERSKQLGLETVPVLFKGALKDFINKHDNQSYADLDEVFTRIFYNKLLEQPSIFDPKVVEEGFCVRLVRSFPKAENFKIKSKKFLEFESKALDKEDTVDMEEQEAQTTENAEGSNN